MQKSLCRPAGVVDGGDRAALLREDPPERIDVASAWQSAGAPDDGDWRSRHEPTRMPFRHFCRSAAQLRLLNVEVMLTESIKSALATRGFEACSLQPA